MSERQLIWLKKLKSQILTTKVEVTSKVVETSTQSDNILVDLESMPDLSGSGEGK